MAKATFSGHLLYLEFGGLQIDTDFLEFDPGTAAVTIDSTAGNDGLQSEHTIREAVAPKLKVLLQSDAGGLAIKAALELGVTGNLIWGEEGNAAGKPKWGIEAKVKMSNIALAHESEQILDVEFMNVGRDWLFDGRTATF